MCSPGPSAPSCVTVLLPWPGLLSLPPSPMEGLFLFKAYLLHEHFFSQIGHGIFLPGTHREISSYAILLLHDLHLYNSFSTSSPPACTFPKGLFCPFMREGRAMNNSVGFRFKLLGFILRRYYLLAGRYLTNHFLYLIFSSVGFSIFERVNAYTSKSKISTQHLEYINKVECPFLGYIVHT